MKETDACLGAGSPMLWLEAVNHSVSLQQQEESHQQVRESSKKELRKTKA